METHPISLNDQQLKAVRANQPRILVEACPGSGKTRCIVERVAWLIEEKKASPFEFCLMTFSRLAAKEMRERIEERIGPDAHKIQISTFHALALNLLHRFGEIIGYSKKYSTVYGEFEERFLILEVAKKMGYHKKTWKKCKKEDVDNAFGYYYGTGIEPNKDDHIIRNLFDVFIDWCREFNSYTYGSLLIGMKLLIPDIAQYLNWKHIIIDECQDNSILQWEIAELLCKSLKASLYCVSDTDQTLYEWRYACPEYILKNQDTFKILKLETNYRSDANIVNAANELIEHNVDRIPKTMIPFEDAQTPIQLTGGMDSSGICSLLKALMESTLSNSGSDVNRAVLCRVHGPLAKLSRLLDEAHIDHTYVGKQSKLTNSEPFRRLHAFLKLLVNPFDNFAFLLIKDLIGIDDTEYGIIKKYATQEGWSHFSSWTRRKVNQWVNYYGDNFGNPFLTDAIHQLEELINEHVEKSSDFIETFQFIYQYRLNNMHSPSIQQYLDWLSTFDLQDEIDASKKNLQLMTIHAAKGLEWPTVIVAGVNEDILPSKQALKNDEIEAERRLAYVAWTRAEDTFNIDCPAAER